MSIEIHRNHIKDAAERKIAQLNKELEIAVEDENTLEQTAIKKTKKLLRTSHKMDLSHCKTIDDIKNSIPNELKDVW